MSTASVLADAGITVYAFDLCSGDLLITPVPANGLQFGSRLNDSGTCQFTMDLAEPTRRLVSAAILDYNGNPFKVIIDRQGVIVWAGIMWDQNYQAGKPLVLAGKEMLSYFDHRVIAATYDKTTFPSGIDPAQLVYRAIHDAQSVPNGSIGLQVASATSRVSWIIPGYSVSQRTFVSQVLSDVTQGITPGTGGVDVNVTTAWSGDVPVSTVNIASPRAGRVAGSTGLIIDLTRVLDFTWPITAGQTGNHILASAAGAGQAQLQANLHAAIPVGGRGQAPLLEQVLSFPNVQTQSMLTAMSRGAIQMFGQPVATPTVTIPIDFPTCALGDWLVGDDIRIVCPAGHERFPNGLDQYWRIVAHQVNVPDEGVPTVLLTLNQPPIF